MSTASGYLYDPERLGQAVRRARYARPCGCCGEPTDGSGGFKQQRLCCQKCRNWTLEAIVEAMRRWGEAHGGVPPTVNDWCHADVDHPVATTVRRWGWNECLLKAGFALRCDRRPETWEWMLAQVRAGISVPEIARALGVSKANIYRRFRYRGLSVKAERPAHA